MPDNITLNKSSVFNLLTDLRLLFWVLVALAAIIAFQQINMGDAHMQNLAIYKLSFYNLIHHTNIYAGGQFYNKIPLDLYKYSPAFALLFAPLAVLPLSVSIFLWNMLNVLLFFFAIRSLPIESKKKSIVIWLVLIELVTSVQNNQSNLIMAALLIFAFTAMEKKNILLATFCIVFSIYIKLFGAVAFLLFFLYPGKVKFVAYTVLWSVILFFLPLVVLPFSELMDIYKDWRAMLSYDQSISWGLSVMAIVKAWFNLNIPKLYAQLAGAILLAIPIISIKSHQNIRFRILYLCSILIWVVTFNHKSESPSFIISLAGIAIWFVSEKVTPLTAFLVLFAMVVTSLAHSDLLSVSVRNGFIDAYVIKGLPSFIMWVVIQYKLYVMAFKPQPLQAQGSTGELQK